VNAGLAAVAVSNLEGSALSPRWGFGRFFRSHTAYAVGFILSPLRG